MTSRGRKRWFDVLRIAICAAALWFVLRGVSYHDRIVLRGDGGTLIGHIEETGNPVVIRLTDGRLQSVPREAIARDEYDETRILFGLKTALAQSNKWLLMAAVLIHLPVAVFQALRLRWLLQAQDIRLRYWECIKLSYAGNFLNFTTPLGSHAGDVFKGYFVTTHTQQHKTEAVTTIVVDRMIGLGTLLVSVALITTLFSGEGRLSVLQPYVLTALVIGVVAAAIYLSPAVRRYIRIPERWLERVPALGHVKRMDRATRGLVRHKKELAGAVLATVILQVLAVGAYFAVAVALIFDAGWSNVLEYYAYFYAGAVVQALPGPPQGLGTVELAYRYFFDPYGSPSQILCLAFLVRIVVLVVALPGLAVTITGAYHPREALTSEPEVTRLANAEPAPSPPAGKHDVAAT